MSEENENTLLKNLLEYIPIAVFFIVFILFKDDVVVLFGRDLSGFVLATLAFVPLVVFATATSWIVLKEVSRVQLLTLVLVVVFGGMTIFFNDERFLKIKPTLIYCLFSIILLISLLSISGESFNTKGFKIFLFFLTLFNPSKSFFSSFCS